MRTELLKKLIEGDDRGHSFFDPFIKDDVEVTEENVRFMLGDALDTWAGDDNTLGSRQARLNAAKLLKRWREDREWQDAAVAYVLTETQNAAREAARGK